MANLLGEGPHPELLCSSAREQAALLDSVLRSAEATAGVEAREGADPSADLRMGGGGRPGGGGVRRAAVAAGAETRLSGRAALWKKVKNF